MHNRTSKCCIFATLPPKTWADACPFAACGHYLLQPADSSLTEAMRAAVEQLVYGPKPQQRPGTPRVFDPYEDEWGNQLEED